MQDPLSFWRRLSAPRRWLALAATAGAFLSILALGRMGSSTDQSLLYAGLDSRAAGEVIAALEQSAVPEAAEALRLTQLSYREGRATLLELLDAQNAYRVAQTGLVEARLAQALATAELGRVAAL